MNYLKPLVGAAVALTLAGCNSQQQINPNASLSEADQSAPTVLKVFPEPGSTNVPVDTRLTFVLSKPVRLPALSLDAIDLVSLNGDISVPGSLSLDPISHTLVFRPAAQLDEMTSYRFQLREKIVDKTGNALEVVNGTFTTGHGGAG